MKINQLSILVLLFTLCACGDDKLAKPNTSDPGKDMGRDTRKDLPKVEDLSGPEDLGKDVKPTDASDMEDFGRTLQNYRSCESNADCPVGLGQCIVELTLNRQDENGSDSVLISDVLEGVDAGKGICTRNCTLSDTECSGLSANGATPDAEPFVCQLIYVGTPPYPEVSPAFPFDTMLKTQNLEGGIAFGSICRPPFQLNKDIDRGFCADCMGGVACPGTATCWNSLTQAEAVEGESGMCLGRCSDSKPCPGGFSCDALGGESYCRPILDTCSSCLDKDGDGRGNGRCGTDAVPITNYDCDDENGDVYFDADQPNHAFPIFCDVSNDYNCNGLSDASEEVGSNDFGNDHCTVCFDECRGAVPNGSSQCIANECRADCTDDTKWADCDGDLTNGCEQAVDDPTRVYYRDRDQDGFGDANDSIFACDPVNPPAGYVADNTDCNDVEITIFPGADEICDGVDQNCDLVVDNNAVEAGQVCNTPGSVGACVDGGITKCENAAVVCEQITQPVDEVCNNKDDDCDGRTDEDPVSGPRWCPNIDSDFYGDCANAVISCVNPGGYRRYTSDTNLWDCDDSNPAVYPFAGEDCNTSYDDDCDGLINDADPSSLRNKKTFVEDPDGDGYRGAGAGQVTQCIAPAAGWSVKIGNNDCEPNNPNIHPGKTETCATPFDDNCNGDLDDAPASETHVYYRDIDGDGWGVSLRRFCSLSAPVGFSTKSGDCNDNQNTRTVLSNGHTYTGADQHPMNTEHCEGFDNNCNGTINDGCPLDYSLSNYRMEGNPEGGGLSLPYTDAFCGAGEMLVGLKLFYIEQAGTCATNGGVHGVQARCANPRIAEDNQNDPFSYANRRGTIHNSSTIGGTGPYLGPLCDHLRKVQNVTCAGVGRAMTGIKGYSGSRIDKLAILCNEHMFSDPALVNPTTVSIGNPADSGFFPSNFAGGTSFSHSCANNEVAVGIRSHYNGGLVTSIELRCADIATVNQ